MFLLIILPIFIVFSNCELIQWDDRMFEKCSKELRGSSQNDDNLKCYWINRHMIIYKIEVLNRNPFLFQFHNLIHRRLAKRAVIEAEQLQLEQLKVIGTGPHHAEVSQVRKANGTWLDHLGKPNFARMFNNLQHVIKALDLRTSEPWQILSYNSDGYYAPHFDYLDPHSNIELLNSRGNRIATVLAVLQTAKRGGTTVFPKLNINIRPKAGDVIVWINYLTNGGSDQLTLHAACPIKEGVKIAATLWVHSKKQELSLPCSLNPEEFDASNFFS